MKTLTPFIFYQNNSPCLEHDRNNVGYFIFSTGHIFGNWEITVTDSYGITLTPRKILKFALRTATRTSAMRIVCIRMVSSTTTVGIPQIPTGVSHSPGLNNDNDGCFIAKIGSVIPYDGDWDPNFLSIIPTENSRAN